MTARMPKSQLYSCRRCSPAVSMKPVMVTVLPLTDTVGSAVTLRFCTTVWSATFAFLTRTCSRYSKKWNPSVVYSALDNKQLSAIKQLQSSGVITYAIASRIGITVRCKS